MRSSFYEYLRTLLVPGLRNSQYEYADELIRFSTTQRAWLDIGCGHGVVPDWTRHEALELRPLAGVDLDLAALRRNQHVRFRVMASGEALPFDTASFDLITAYMVVEHVAVPRSLFL